MWRRGETRYNNMRISLSKRCDPILHGAARYDTCGQGKKDTTILIKIQISTAKYNNVRLRGG